MKEKYEHDETDRGSSEKRPDRHQLYLRQVELLDTFLAHGTITQAQYDKSFHDLTVKMGEK